MTTCRRKEEFVQAFRFDGTIENCGDIVSALEIARFTFTMDDVNTTINVKTLVNGIHGYTDVCIGDWIVSDDGIHVYKNEGFEKTYVIIPKQNKYISAVQNTESGDWVVEYETRRLGVISDEEFINEWVKYETLNG